MTSNLSPPFHNKAFVALRAASIILIAATIAGCGVRGFKKDGATQEDFDQDLRQCLYESNRPENTCYHDPFTGCQRDKARNYCMTQKGWTISRDEGKFMLPD